MLTEKPALKSLRRRLPPSLAYGAQWLCGLLPVEVYQGSEYRRWRRRLAASELWTAERHREAQAAELASLVEHCFRNVPYYRDLARRLGLQSRDFRDPGDLGKLPLLTKEMIRDNLESFIAQDYPRRSLQYCTTGGSTGVPLGFHNAPEVLPREAAFVAHLWEEHGYRPWKDRCAVLRGVFLRGPRGECWGYNPLRRELHLSSYALTEHNAAAYADQVRAHRARFLQAYPSAATLLAQYLGKTGRARGLFARIFVASENLYEDQRRLIEESFGCPVVDFYGQSEHVAMARQCGRSSRYHFFPQYGIVEFLDPAGNAVTGAGKVAEVVATGFLNRATPMLRYRTGDLVVIAEGPCPCGRNYPMVDRIEGRLQELVQTPDGRTVSMTALNMHNDLFDRVLQFQFEQERPESVLLRVVPKPGYSEADTRRIGEEIGGKLGASVRLRVELAEKIAPGPGGKHRFLVQRLPVPGHPRGC